MIQRPQFKAHLSVETVTGEGVFLVSEIGHSVLSGRLFELVVPLIDGRRSVDDIAEELRAQASPAEIYYALTLLEQKGFLGEVDGTPAGEATFWAIQNIAPATAGRRLAEIPVSVTTFGEVTVEPFLALLESLRVRVGEAGDLGVVLTDDYLRKGLAVYNQEALRSGRPWILIRPVGGQTLIGPLFHPGRTGCWECLAQRLRINRAVEEYIQRKQHRDEPLLIPGAVTPATQQIAFGVAATEIERWIARDGPPRSEGRVLSLDMVSWQTQLHTLTRQPQCPACGDPASAPPRSAAPVVLKSCKKGFTEDGGHRAVAPEQTLQLYECHVSPITGAVSVLQPHPAANNGIVHVYLAGENHAAPHHHLKHLEKNLRSRSSGKGVTDLQAKSSCLCEALERYSGVFRGTEIRRRARLEDLDGLGIHPNDFMRFSERQYRQRDSINARGARGQFVPMPFDPAVEIDWTPVWSLTRKVHRYLPTSYCYFAYPSPKDQIYCVGCSNGNAAGNTLEEAVLHGLLELVERDGVALWWYNRLLRPAVDVDSFNEPYLGKLKAWLGERRRELWVLDLTTDLGIPVFAALSRRRDHPHEHVMVGFGAHLDPRMALLRAVTELNQGLTLLLLADDGTDETLDTFEESDTLTWLKTATVANQPYLLPDGSAPPRTAGDYPRRWTDDLKDDVLLCREVVEQRGLEMLILDLTRPDIGLPVVKVIVPGLRHFWARFAPGRLYDIPVALGWLTRPLAEEELNSVPLFL